MLQSIAFKQVISLKLSSKIGWDRSRLAIPPQSFKHVASILSTNLTFTTFSGTKHNGKIPICLTLNLK